MESYVRGPEIELTTKTIPQVFEETAARFAGRDALLFSFDVDDVCFIGYPIPHPRAVAQDTADGALATILGPLRAAILQVLRQPLTVGDLATAVHCAPTTATYHLHQLAAADLITREKSGSSVWVSRTARGDELVNLLSD